MPLNDQIFENSMLTGIECWKASFQCLVLKL